MFSLSQFAAGGNSVQIEIVNHKVRSICVYPSKNLKWQRQVRDRIKKAKETMENESKKLKKMQYMICIGANNEMGMTAGKSSVGNGIDGSITKNNKAKTQRSKKPAMKFVGKKGGASNEKGKKEEVQAPINGVYFRNDGSVYHKSENGQVSPVDDTLFFHPSLQKVVFYSDGKYKDKDTQEIVEEWVSKEQKQDTTKSFNEDRGLLNYFDVKGREDLESNSESFIHESRALTHDNDTFAQDLEDLWNYQSGF